MAEMVEDPSIGLPTPPAQDMISALLSAQGQPAEMAPSPGSSLGELLPVLAQFLQLLGDSFKAGAVVGTDAAKASPPPAKPSPSRMSHMSLGAMSNTPSRKERPSY